MSTTFVGRVPTLKGPNYLQWAPLITGYLHTIGAWWAITTDEPAAENNDVTGKVTNQARIDSWHDTNNKCLGTFTMTIDPNLIHPFEGNKTASDTWKALKEKFSTPSTASKYLEFKAMYNTAIPEDAHPQAAFMKIRKHLDLLRDYQCEVPATLQSLLVLAKLLQHMDVFTQILNMSTSTKMTPSFVKGKEKEKKEDPLPTLADIKRMALIAWQQHQSGEKKSCDHVHKISTVKCNPGDPQFQQQQQGGNRLPQQQQSGQQQKKKKNCGKHSAAGQAKQDAREQHHANTHSNEAPTASFAFATSLPDDPIIVSTGPTVINLCHSTHITGEAHYGLPTFPQTKRTISLTHCIGVTPTTETVRHLDKVANRASCAPTP